MSENSEEPNAVDGSEETTPLITRRGAIRGTALTATAGLLGGAGLWYASQPALAVTEAGEWIAESAEITTQDGTVDSITFGDPDEETDSEELEEGDNGLIVEWEGFNSATTDIDFGVSVAGTDGEDGGDWAGGSPTTASEELATGQAGVDGTNGTETFTWSDIFPDSQPVDVAEHTEIELSDFEAEEDGSTTIRELELSIEAIVPDEGDLTATETTTATITVTNQEASLEVGGQGTLEITSDEEVGE